MNNKTKGAIAAAAGAVILAGGAGTMAAWNDSTTGTDGGTITAGELNIEQVGSGTWTWGDGTTTFNPAEDRLIPGDTVQYTATYNITLEGTNLTATLKPELREVDGDLADLLTVGTAGGDEVEVDSSGQKSVTTTITFDESKAGDNGGMNEQADLSGATVTLTQN